MKNRLISFSLKFKKNIAIIIISFIIFDFTDNRLVYQKINIAYGLDNKYRYPNLI